MSARITQTALTGSLWPKKPLVATNGQLVEATFEEATQKFTSIAFTPNDPLRFAAGDNTGAVYLFALQKNRFTVCARLNGPVLSVAFGQDKDTLHASCGMVLYTINLDSCRIESKVKGPHRNFIVSVKSPIVSGNVYFSTRVGTMSHDGIALWYTGSSKVPNPESRAETAGKFLSMSLTDKFVYAVDGAAGTINAYSTNKMEPMARVSIRPYLPTTIAAFDNFIVVGTKHNPSLLFLKVETLEGISSVSLPLPRDAPHTHVAAVSVVQSTGNLIAAQLSDSKCYFISTSDYGVVMSITPKTHSEPIRFDFGSDQYGATVQGGALYAYHLPTAKAYYDRTHTQQQTSAMRDGAENRSALPFLKAPGEKEKENDVTRQDVGTGDTLVSHQLETTGVAPGITKSVLTVDSSLSKASKISADKDGTPTWVKVNLVDRAAELKGLATEKQPMLARDAVMESFGGPEVQAKLEAAKKANLKPPMKVRSKTVAGNTVKKTEAEKKQNSSVTLRAFLDHDAKVLNLEKLRSMLMKFGSYPERYRPLIWRFLLQLPDKTKIAPHFNNLASKGLHPGVPALMKPYPLPDSKLRVSLERVLSCLAYHAPVFSVAHWLPSSVFPFVKAHGMDIQGSVEVIISFFLNWGQEFFVYYPHPPVSVLSYVGHLLKAEDPQLWQHLQDCACGSEDYIWEVMQPLYSEVLTRNEWLQLMDHVFSNEPLWIFLFHVRWLVQVREVLMSLQDHGEIYALLHRTIPTDLNAIIKQTYRLHSRCVRNELSEPYHQLLVFDESGYPTTVMANDAVITSKVRELEKIEEHEREVVAMKTRTQQVEKQLAQAAMLEDAFISKQKALVAAKFDASNGIWQQQVALEKERQHLRDIEQASRLAAVEDQLRSAQRLAAVQEEVAAANATIRDAEIDRQRETMKWDFSDKMTHQEMARLEDAARHRLSTVLTVTNEDINAERDLHMSLAAEHNISIGASRLNQSGMSNQGQQQQRRHEDQGSTLLTTVPPIPEVAAPRPTTMPPDPQEPAHAVPHFTASVRNLPQQQQSPPTTSTPASSRGTSTGQRQGSNPTGTTTTTETSMPPSSAGSDPIGYYRNLQQRIQEGVSKAQEEQRTALEGLQTSYARRAWAEQQEILDEEERRAAAQEMLRQHQLREERREQEEAEVSDVDEEVSVEEGEEHSGTTVTEGDEDADRTMASPHRGEGSVEGDTYAASTGSSIARAILRPPAARTSATGYDVTSSSATDPTSE